MESSFYAFMKSEETTWKMVAYPCFQDVTRFIQVPEEWVVSVLCGGDIDHKSQAPVVRKPIKITRG